MKLKLLIAGLAIALTAAACGSDDETSSDAGTDDASADVATDDGGTDSGDGDGECVPRHDITTVTEGKLSVAVYTYLPFSDLDGAGLTGAEGDIITRIAEMECLEVEPVPGDASAMISSITSGRADTTIGSWYRTEEREEIVILGAPVIADRLTLISGDDTVASVQDLKGLKVGSILGFLWNDDLANLVGDDLNLYDGGQAMYSDLAAGRIDVVVDTYPSAQAMLESIPIEGLNFITPPADEAVVSTQKPGQTNFPVNQDNPDLAKALDENLAELRATGELEEIVVSYGFLPEAADPGEPNKL